MACSQVVVGGADHAEIDLPRPVGADAEDLVGFQDAEQIDLHLER